MRLRGFISQCIVVILLAMSVLTPALIATLPTNTSAQTAINPVERAADNSIALGNLFQNCRVIALDTGYLANQSTLTRCIQELMAAIFIVALLWIVVSLAANMLGVVLRSGEGSKGGGPIAQARKKVENGLIGLVLIGGPYLILSLFSNNLANTDLLYTGVDSRLIQGCYQMRRDVDAGRSPSLIAADFRTLTDTFLTQKKNSQRTIVTLSGDYNEYALNLRYILSDFCVNRIPLASFRQELQNAANRAYLERKTRAELASMTRKRAELTSIVVSPTPRTEAELEQSVESTYRSCLSDLPNLSLYCEFVRVGAEVAAYQPQDTPQNVAERNRWVIFLGRLYEIGYPNEQIGNAIADALILSVKRGQLDVASTRNAISTLERFVTTQVYINNREQFTRELHLQRLAYVSQAINAVLENNTNVDGRIAAAVVGFSSTFILTTAPENDSDRQFVALKAAVVQNVMNFLIDSNYSDKAVVTTSFKTLGDSLRSLNKTVEAEVVGVVSTVASRFMQKQEDNANGNYVITDADYYEAALDLGLYAVDIAVRTNQDVALDARLINITRISGAFGREVVQKEIACAQNVYQITRNADTAQLAKSISEQSNDEAARQNAQRLYNQTIDELRSAYNAFQNRDQNVVPDNDSLLGIMSDDRQVRNGIARCNGIETQRVYTLSRDLIQAALPADSPGIAREAVEFVYNTVTLLNTSNYSEAVKEDYIALGLMNLARSALTYIPDSSDTNTRIAATLGQTAVQLTSLYLEGSIACKTSLENLKNNPPGGFIQVDWAGVYERYNTGQNDEQDARIFRTREDTKPCLGLIASQVLEAGLGTAQAIYSLAANGNTDPRISQLLDPNNSNSVAYLVVETIRDIENGVIYPQAVAVRVIDTGATLIKNFATNNDPRFTRAVDSITNQTTRLIRLSLDREISCDNARKGTGGNLSDCGGITEFDFSRSLLSVIKSVVEIQGPGQQFFDQVLATIEDYIDELEGGALTNNEAAVGLLTVANSGVQAIVAELSNKKDLTNDDRTRLAVASRVSGKGFSIAEKYFKNREACDQQIVVYEQLIRQNRISDSDKIFLSRAIGYTPGINELGNQNFRFSDSDIKGLERVIEVCANTISLDAANAVIDVVAEFVRIPGFPMQQAVDLANYLVNSTPENFSDYRAGQYLVRLFAATININSCTPKDGENLTQEQQQSRNQGCSAVASVLDFVDRTLQLYIDGRATDPNFARELLYLGHNIAITLGADRFTAEKVQQLGERVIGLWERSLNGNTAIFNEKTVAAEFLNFAGAMLPHVLKADRNTTELIQVWSQVAATALTAPEAVNASTAVRTTAAFVASKIWQCDTNNGRPNQGAECAENAAANTSVFMGVIDAVNIGPVSNERYINLCYDAAGNEICNARIAALITEMETKISAGNQNAYRLANSYLYSKDRDLRVRPNQLGSSFVFSGEQRTVLEARVSVCDAVTIPDDNTTPQDQEDAAANEPTLDYYDEKRDLSQISGNPCLRNPMVQLSSVLSLDLDKLIDSVLVGLASPYGLIGIGENKIVGTLTKVAREIDFNRVAAGDNSTIGRTLTRNIGYVLRSLPIEQVTGDSAASIIRLVGDLPWETIIYNPLALGGAECAPVAKPRTAAIFYPNGMVVGGVKTEVYHSDFGPSYTVTSQPPQARKAITITPTDVGVDKPSSPGLAPACTAALVTGILSRIDFSILFSTLAGAGGAEQAARTGQLVNQVVGVLDRMDFTCPLGQRLANGSCDQSFGTVAKNVINILGFLDLSLIADQRTATFVRTFATNFPADVFTTGFSLAQMDKWVNLTALVAEQIGVDTKIVQQFRQTYNDIVTVLNQASAIIQTIDNVLKYVNAILDGLESLRIAGIDLISPEASGTLRQIVNDARTLIVEIRRVTDQFDQLKEVQLGYRIVITVAYFEAWESQSA